MEILANRRLSARSMGFDRMSAGEILNHLATLPEARRIHSEPPLDAVVIVAGIEVGSTHIPTEAALRRTWRERRGRGATPLLLVADDPSRKGSVWALGLTDYNGPLRSVDGAMLTEALEQISVKPRLDAIRELTSELERLDQAGIPGLKLKEMLTLHTLDTRLRNDPVRWEVAANSADTIGRDADWRTILTKLGYELERLPHRGHLARYEGKPVLVVHPFDHPSRFSRLDLQGRPSEGVLINDCAREGAPYGILASGGRLRLFEAAPTRGSAVTQYVELDAAVLQVDDQPLLGLLSPTFLVDGVFTHLREEARLFGVGLRKRLDERLRQRVLPVLGRALGRWADAAGKDLTNDAVREDLEHAALTLVFRLLFLAYAESGGHLPIDNRNYQQASLSSLVDEAAETQEKLSPRSTSLWDRLGLLVKAMRNGNPAWGVPAYNGALFAAHGFAGSETLEAADIADPDFASMLVGLGRDEETGAGVDYSTLEIGHLGHIYEGLLSLDLTVADKPLRYDHKTDRYVQASGDDIHEVEPGDLVWLSHEGGRKSAGVYYTRSELVSHLVRESVLPGFQRHLGEVRALAEKDPDDAAARLFDFAVLDPACGSAHFLVAVVGELADATVRFLADTPLPRIHDRLDRLRAGASPGAVVDDAALIRRLVMKRCVFGVDLSPMGAEVAKISLWLASFVPGLALTYLDRNVIVGNSLIGVSHPDVLRPPGKGADQTWILEDALDEGLRSAAKSLLEIAESDDRSPEEIETSKKADAAARAATVGLERLFNLWTAGGFGLKGARQEVELHGSEILRERANGLTERAARLAEQHRFLHWPLVFPGVFVGPTPGFDAIVGNPPWEEVTVEELAFYALFAPGLRSLSEAERRRSIEELLQARSDLRDLYEAELERVAEQRSYYVQSGDYAARRGDPDLYKFFCQRYGSLLRPGGALGVVLPRNALAAKGSEEFRRWLFEMNTCNRVDFLLNAGRWAFDSEPRYTIALVSATSAVPAENHKVRVVGTAASADQWQTQASSSGLALDQRAFGPGWTVPLLRNQSEADLLAKLRNGSPFPIGSAGQWKCFPVRELDETNNRKFWEAATTGWPLWKGESFDQYDPHGAEARWCPDNHALRKVVSKPRPGAGSILSEVTSLSMRRKAVIEEVGKARVAFRDVSRATDSRTVRACLIPPRTFLTNKAPYLAFVGGTNQQRAACLGLMNSLAFDWQSRRFVEVNLNFFILEGLIVPDLSAEDFDVIARNAARLSCIDDRFVEFAHSMKVKPGPLDQQARLDLRVEIDARVARAWNLTVNEIELLFSDFTQGAVPPIYRRTLLDRFEQLGA